MAKSTINPNLVCPHCQVRGRVATSQIKSKQGISGGKATGPCSLVGSPFAVLTGGLSLLATGLSKKKLVTEARCGNCSMSWHIG